MSEAANTNTDHDKVTHIRGQEEIRIRYKSRISHVISPTTSKEIFQVRWDPDGVHIYPPKDKEVPDKKELADWLEALKKAIEEEFWG